MNITVYTLPNCMQCKLTKKAFERNELPYAEVDLTTNEVAENMVKDLGYAQAPVVIAGEQHWAGFQPDQIEALAHTEDRPQRAEAVFF